MNALYECYQASLLKLKLRRKSFASSRVVEPHLVTFLELMSCGFCVIPSLHLLRPQVDPFSSQMYIFKTCLEILRTPQAMKVYPEGDQTAGHKGDEDLGQKASGMVNIR
ncbi:hypothetical protein TNCV_2852261 [Trichonephila clavipes]|nr:hypothetical protein TNCV_2852261 [Trichonephila clavipes]